jgi:putative peptidoglycan lipid II flippase
MQRLIKLVYRFKLETYSLLILMNLLLAISAFFKDVAFAHYFGTSSTADAYTLGFFIPDMIGNNLIASALGVTCIPIFSRLLYQKRELIFKKVVQVLVIYISVITLLISIGLFFESHWILSWLGHDLPRKTLSQASQAFHLMIPIVWLIPLTLIGVAYLQTEKAFLVPAIAPVIYHVLLLGVLVSCYFMNVPSIPGGKGYALATTVATGIYFAIIWMSIFKGWKGKGFSQKGVRQRDVSSFLKALAIDFFPYLAILIFSQSLQLVERYFASGSESGTLAALNYAFRLVQFPIWVFVSALTTVLLPNFARDLAAKRPLDAMEQINRALLVTIGLTLIMSFGLFAFRHFIVTLLFKRGAFDEKSVIQTVSILTGYSFAIVGQSISLICLRYFIASRRMSSPLVIYFLGTLCSILIDVYFVPKYGASALGYGASIGATLSGLLFLVGIRREQLRLRRLLGVK